MVWSGLFGEPTEEQKAAYESAKARQEDMANRFRRLLAEELTPDQLEVIRSILSLVANCQSPGVLATFYEGIINGTMFTRDLRLGETPESTAILQLSELGRREAVIDTVAPEHFLEDEEDEEDEDDEDDEFE